MLTVILECRNHEPELAQTLSILVAGAVEGLVSDVVVLDHGSKDGTSKVADAAGCRFHAEWDVKDILDTARGDWVLLVEPGARPQTGWIEEIAEYVSLNKLPARFTASRNYRKPLLQRLARRKKPLELGLLMAKRQAIAAARSGMSLAQLADGQKIKRLSSEIIPSWVASAAR